MLKMKFYKFIFSKVYQQDELIRSLLISSVSGMILLFARVIYTGDFTYLFLIWNLFLAYVPFFISNYISRNSKAQTISFKGISILFAWLMFFPNAPYIFTDFFHLYQRPNIPLWYDLIILSIFAWNGLLIGFVSLRDIQNIISVKFGLKSGWYFAITVLILGSFGVYLGRYLRYNSWDVVTTPIYLTLDLIDIFIKPENNKAAFGMTIGMSVFLITTYYTFKSISNRVIIK